MIGVVDCHDCGRTKLVDDVFECCVDEPEIITQGQLIAELKTALGACYTALAFELENATSREDHMAALQILTILKNAHKALAKVKS